MSEIITHRAIVEPTRWSWLWRVVVERKVQPEGAPPWPWQQAIPTKHVIGSQARAIRKATHWWARADEEAHAAQERLERRVVVGSQA